MEEGGGGREREREGGREGERVRANKGAEGQTEVIIEL